MGVSLVFLVRLALERWRVVRQHFLTLLLLFTTEEQLDCGVDFPPSCTSMVVIAVVLECVGLQDNFGIISYLLGDNMISLVVCVLNLSPECR
jgi:hypothetical protein